MQKNIRQKLCYDQVPAREQKCKSSTLKEFAKKIGYPLTFVYDAIK